MAGRLEGKAAIVVGAGQTPGETMGNGRAIARLFATEGARVLCVDRVEDRAKSTANEILNPPAWTRTCLSRRHFQRE